MLTTTVYSGFCNYISVWSIVYCVQVRQNLSIVDEIDSTLSFLFVAHFGVGVQKSNTYYE